MKIMGLVLLGASSLTFAAPCTDFSGEWAGTCTTAGAGTVEDSIVVTQTECQKVSWGNIELEFGKDIAYTEAFEDHDEKISLRADWNAAKVAFTLKYSVVATQKTGALISTLKGTVAPKLENGKLVTTHDADYTPAGAATQTTKTNCRYSKAR